MALDMDILASPPGQKKYEPLKFWFCDDVRLSIPLTAVLVERGLTAEEIFDYYSNLPENVEVIEEAEELEEEVLSARG
jgi:hypothetical protein